MSVIIESSATNRTKSDSKILIYNRVPKCASTTMENLLSGLKRRNHFSVERSEIYWKYVVLCCGAIILYVTDWCVQAGSQCSGGDRVDLPAGEEEADRGNHGADPRQGRSHAQEGGEGGQGGGARH